MFFFPGFPQVGYCFPFVEGSFWRGGSFKYLKHCHVLVFFDYLKLIASDISWLGDDLFPSGSRPIFRCKLLVQYTSYRYICCRGWISYPVIYGELIFLNRHHKDPVMNQLAVGVRSLLLEAEDSSVLSWPSTSTMTVMAHGNTRRWNLFSEWRTWDAGGKGSHVLYGIILYCCMLYLHTLRDS